jgi:hypothetical protein
MIIKELEEFKSEQKGNTLVFSDIPNSVYHSGVGISSSKIRAFGKSQLHAIEQVQENNPCNELRYSRSCFIGRRGRSI